jgi:predicted Zn-dependent protease
MSMLELIYWLVEILIFVITVCVGEVSNLYCLIKPAPESARIDDLRGAGEIVFIPVGGFPIATIEMYAQFFQETYGLPITILPPLPLPSSAFDSNRGQYIAEEILAEVKRQVPHSGANTPMTPIVFTDQDMYIQKYNWRYAFSLRENDMAVVSSSRMGYSFNPFTEADQEIRDARLRKMVTKNIGILYYHLPFSDHCRSAMYGRVGGPQELDFMNDRL